MGPVGPAGATGSAGPSSVSGTTTTSLTGILKGNGTTVTVATPGTDYVTPAEMTSTLASVVPAGSNAQVQFNNEGKLAGAATLNYNAALGSLAEGLGTASGQYAHAEGNGTQANGSPSHAEGSNTQAQGNNSHAEGDSVQSWQYAEHGEGVWGGSNGQKAMRSHLTLQLDPSATYTYPAPYSSCVTTGELKITGQGGQRISIPAGWTYSFEFNIQAIDPSFNVSRWQGWGTVQNTGSVVAGTLDGVKLLSASNAIVPVYWSQDSQITTNSAIQAAPGGPGIELLNLFLIFDTSSSTGEVVVRVGGNDTYLNLNWYALFTINKLYQQPIAGSGGSIHGSEEVYVMQNVPGIGNVPFTPAGNYTAGTVAREYFRNQVLGWCLFWNGSNWEIASGSISGQVIFWADANDSTGTNPVGSYDGQFGSGWPGMHLSIVELTLP